MAELERLKYEYVNNPNKYPNIRDKTARVTKIDNLKKTADDLIEQYN